MLQLRTKRSAPAASTLVRMRWSPLLVGLFALGCLQNGSAQTSTRKEVLRPGYAGDSACTGCHRAEAESYAHTSHHLASQPATKDSVLGDFREGANILTISNRKDKPAEPVLFFKMDAKNGEFYQTAFTGWGDQLASRAERIDVVTGSGVRGQTYLYTQGDRLFELPVSYWTDGHRWINSPGYVNGTADFLRPVNPGCLECHATYIQPISSSPLTNSYVRDSLITGISCETCHGPGVAHIAKYAGHPANQAGTADTAILNPKKFSRDRQVDACAVCHNGTQRTALTPAFSFVPGRPLSDFFKPIAATTADHPDVHGNQVALLQRSRCYQSSPEMSCSTCHDVHAQEKPAVSYSEGCLTCHKWTSCGESKTRGETIIGQCVTCHMPVETTNLIVSETAGSEVRAKMRNHWIKVYPPG